MNLNSKIVKIASKFIDQHTESYSHRKDSILRKLIRTSRYKLASFGIPITKNEIYLKGLENKFKGQRCFIIGNGPSLNKCDLRLIEGEITFGFNSIFLNYDKMGFLPTFYLVEDVLVAEDRANEINALSGTIKFFGNHIGYCINKGEKTYWLNVLMDYSDYFNFPHFSENALRKVWAGGTVTYLAMQLAFYMGFSEVYLIGYDHSYSVPSSADINGTIIKSTEEDTNHFHPDYFGKGYRWHDPRVDRMEAAYKKAKIHYEKNGRKIYNATVGGELEVFDRVNYYNLFNNPNIKTGEN